MGRRPDARLHPGGAVERSFAEVEPAASTADASPPSLGESHDDSRRGFSEGRSDRDG